MVPGSTGRLGSTAGLPHGWSGTFSVAIEPVRVWFLRSRPWNLETGHHVGGL
jgi:hypothetical protein